MAQRPQHVVVLGAGFVSAPCIEYLSKAGLHCKVVSNIPGEADRLAAQFPNVEPLTMDVVADSPELCTLIKESDLVISLLPYPLHPVVAKICIAMETNMVTASYVTSELKELHEQACNAGITILNEVGLDPGIDHFLAVKTIGDIMSNENKRITSFKSWCGGLPAPEFADNPLGYKFSWSPKGVLLALNRPAKYMEHDEVKDIPPGQLLNHVNDLDFESTLAWPDYPNGNLEGYPNGNALDYIDLYGLHSASTVLRGTIRYKGS